MVNNEWYKIPEWWSAIGTIFVGLVAVGIAIFQEKIVNFFRNTKIENSLKLTPPDCHKIKLTDQLGAEIDCYYIRTKILNIGKRSAENVEVMINNCWKIENSKKIKLKNFPSYEFKMEPLRRDYYEQNIT